MANTLKSVAIVLLNTSFTSLYQVPVGTTFSVGMVHIANTSSSSVTVSVCLVPSAASPSAGNALLWNFEIPPNQFMEFLKGDIWSEGSTLQARASTTGDVTVKLAGIETT